MRSMASLKTNLSSVRWTMADIENRVYAQNKTRRIWETSTRTPEQINRTVDLMNTLANNTAVMNNTLEMLVKQVIPKSRSNGKKSWCEHDDHQSCNVAYWHCHYCWSQLLWPLFDIITKRFTGDWYVKRAMGDHERPRQPPTFLHTPQEMWERAVEYFKWCGQHQLVEEKIGFFQGEPTSGFVGHKRPMTVSGLCIFPEYRPHNVVQLQKSRILQHHYSHRRNNVRAKVCRCCCWSV